MARKSGENSSRKDRAPKRKGKNFYSNKHNDNSSNNKCNDDNSELDGSMFNDTASIVSGISNVSRYDLDNDNTLTSNAELQDESIDNEFEDNGENSFMAKLSKVLDELQTAKSTKERIRLYETLSNAFITHYCAEEYLENRKFTFQDIIEHGLKRGGDEAGFAAQILSLILITLGDTIYCDELFRVTYDQLERILINPTAKPLTRSKCATALSFGCFVTDYGLEKTQDLMNKLLLITCTNVKSGPDMASLAEMNALKVCTLDAFNFLMILNIGSNQLMKNCIQPNIVKLVKCLESDHLELRVAAGECFALLFEDCMDNDRSFTMYNIDELKERLEILATDSQKYRSKKELRAQRSNFRQILRTIEGDEYGSETIKIGDECLTLDCWKLKCYYNTICSVLGSGMNLHLSQNQTLRDIFDMGPITLDICRKSINNNKKYLKNANRKFREVNRLKMREKRRDYYSEV